MKKTIKIMNNQINKMESKKKGAKPNLNTNEPELKEKKIKVIKPKKALSDYNKLTSWMRKNNQANLGTKKAVLIEQLNSNPELLKKYKVEVESLNMKANYINDTEFITKPVIEKPDISTTVETTI